MMGRRIGSWDAGWEALGAHLGNRFLWCVYAMYMATICRGPTYWDIHNLDHKRTWQLMLSMCQ